MLENEKTIKPENIERYGSLNYHVLEGIADWVRVVDISGTIIYANKAMKEDLGDDIIGLKCYQAHCRTGKCNFCITERSIVTGEIVQKEEEIDNNYYSIKSSPVRNGNGEIFAAVEVFRNVTRERKLEYELINKNRKMNQDLQFAKTIQKQILPRKGTIGSINLDYIYKPSEMLSGDMFDMFDIDEDHVGIYISDVAGNGVAASMMTMFVRQTMRTMQNRFLSPSKALSRLHKRFIDLNLEPDNYFTIFYGILNKKTRVFKYANAGHNCIPIRYNNQDIELLENKGYPIISLFDDIKYKEKKTIIDNDDKILFYTDGVTEARNSIGVEFGLDRLVEIVESRKNNLLEEIDTSIMNHSWGEQQDDIAIVLIGLEDI